MDKKFDLDRFLSVLGLIGPAVLMLVPGGAKIAALLPDIIKAIKEAELIHGATGPEKKAHVLAVVRAAVAVANGTGRLTLEPAEVEQIAGTAIDLIIGVINVIQGARVVKGG